MQAATTTTTSAAAPPIVYDDDSDGDDEGGSQGAVPGPRPAPRPKPAANPEGRVRVSGRVTSVSVRGDVLHYPAHARVRATKTGLVVEEGGGSFVAGARRLAAPLERLEAPFRCAAELVGARVAPTLRVLLSGSSSLCLRAAAGPPIERLELSARRTASVRADAGAPVVQRAVLELAQEARLERLVVGTAELKLDGNAQARLVVAAAEPAAAQRRRLSDGVAQGYRVITSHGMISSRARATLERADGTPWRAQDAACRSCYRRRAIVRGVICVLAAAPPVFGGAAPRPVLPAPRPQPRPASTSSYQRVARL